MNDTVTPPPDPYPTLEEWLIAVTVLAPRNEREYAFYIRLRVDTRLPPDPALFYGQEAFAAFGGWDAVPSIRNHRRSQEAIQKTKAAPAPEPERVVVTEIAPIVATTQV
jgi:hypothetical protein